MELLIKQLKQNNQIFVPQTTAEAVLVKDSNRIITLDKALNKKLEAIITPLGSGLDYTASGKTVVLTHSNSITPNTEAQPLLLKFDNRGHITEAKPMGKLTVVINNSKYIETDGSQDKALLFGDDFKTDENNIIGLNWNNINGIT